MDNYALYQPDEATRIMPRFEDNDIWLTLEEISDLFGCTRDNAAYHLRNAMTEELVFRLVCRAFRETPAYGVPHTVNRYNLDAILSVGYRVNSPRWLAFFLWANAHIKERLSKPSRRLPRDCNSGITEAMRRLVLENPDARHTVAEVADVCHCSMFTVKNYARMFGWGLHGGYIVPPALPVPEAPANA